MGTTTALCLLALATASLRGPVTVGLKPTEQVEDATAAWVRAVTVKNSPRLVTDQFCSDGILWGTVSQEIRGGAHGGGNEVGGAIERYFVSLRRFPAFR